MNIQILTDNDVNEPLTIAYVMKKRTFYGHVYVLKSYFNIIDTAAAWALARD